MEIGDKILKFAQAKYLYDQKYCDLTQEFYDLCQLHNEELLMSLLKNNQHHVESLYRLAFLLRFKNDEADLYNELIERALHILHESKSLDFNFCRKNVQLLYNVYENR
ncbi:hypothetical protein MXB_1799 [Myxobolus squamalis]|nr:hypothetical protein MXB_1799 [Myxobolus squamalis]